MKLQDDPAQLVNAFADGKNRFPTLLRLQSLEMSVRLWACPIDLVSLLLDRPAAE